jgi:hypothetical protein
MTYSRSHPSDLIAANKTWSADVKKVTPDFFTESAKKQSPKILWFGCACFPATPGGVVFSGLVPVLVVHLKWWADIPFRAVLSDRW